MCSSDLNREIGAARYFNKAVGQLAVERGRLEFLSSEIRSFLEMIGKLIHQPWIIEDKWIDLESNSIETKFLPTCFDVATPRETGAFNDVKNLALEKVVEASWRANQIENLFDIYETSNGMKKGMLAERLDSDSRLRNRVTEELDSDKYFTSVGEFHVKELARRVQNEILPTQKIGRAHV